MSATFNIPKSTNATGQSGNNGIPRNLLSNVDAAQVGNNLNSQLKYMLPKGEKAFDKALDLSGGKFGTGTSSDNALRKFHQVTMYFHPYITQSEKKDDQGRAIDGGKSTRYTITSNLPDNLQYKVGGQWSKPLDWTADATVDLLLRTASNEHRSLRTMASTGLMWTAPDPLEITFTIHAFDDTSSESHINIQECLQILGNYTLPKEGQSIYLDVPAGIDLGLEVKTSKKTYNTGKNVTKNKVFRNEGNDKSPTTYSKNLDILIGGMLFLQRVSIKNFTVNYTNTKNMLLHYWGSGNGHVTGQRLLPMTADITITLTTVRGLSCINYGKMLMLGTSENDSIINQTADEAVLGSVDLSSVV